MRTFNFAAALAVAVGLGGCVDAPPRYVRSVEQVSPPPIPDVIAYPAQGQSAQQADRDRYECHIWAVKQTGFDPSLPGLPPEQRVRVVQGPPPGADVMGGAVTGAVLGAVVSSPRQTGQGALLGALAGAAIGAVAEASRNDAIERADEADHARHAARVSAQTQQVGAYRRAIGACLAGRGYTVR
jgi:outer membrane lipoprotein SlyB